MRRQLNVRIPDTTAQQIAALTDSGYESQAHVIIIAVDRLYHQQEIKRMTTYDTLQEITGHEAGAVVYSTGDVWIGNWTQIAGIPREFVAGSIGLGETLTATPTDVPHEAIHAMRQHVAAQGEEPIDETEYPYSAWEVTASNETVTVVTCAGWN